ncbi:flagellar basal body protein [Neisseriaceae bacterium TC5R-5]|nr:flagellar basal body protein [Neisseriaceae bacterium TC5R-5]
MSGMIAQSQIVHTALDGLQLRQQALAQNIANLNTPGYQPLRVDFEQALSQAVAGNTRAQPAQVYSSSEPVSLNREVAMLSETVLRYQTLLKGLNQQLAVLHLAISEGKR